MKTKIKVLMYKILPNYLNIYLLNKYREIANIKLAYDIKKFKKNISETNSDIYFEDDHFKYNLNSENGMIDYFLYKGKVFESDYLSYLKKNIIKKGFIILDVGANIGLHTIMYAKWVGENGHVYAFEPLPRFFNQIKKSIKLNNYNNVTPVNYGASNKNEDLLLYVDSINGGSSSIYESKNSIKKEKISLIKIDNFINQNNINKIDFVKIDVEGHEIEVVEGMQNTIKKHFPIIFIEYSPTFYKKRNKLKEGKEMINNFLNLGYHIYNLDKLEKVIDVDNLTNNLIKENDQANLIMSKLK